MGQMDINLINAYINWVLTGYLIRPSIISTNYLYSAPTKANKRDDLARFEPYTWTSCEEKEGDVGKRNNTPNPCQQRDHHWGGMRCASWH